MRLRRCDALLHSLRDKRTLGWSAGPLKDVEVLGWRKQRA
jgi:hypothetical protein